MHITLSPHITAERLEAAVRALEIRLIAQPDGIVVGYPDGHDVIVDLKTAISPERHTNATVRKFFRYRRQRHAHQTEPPDAA